MLTKFLQSARANSNCFFLFCVNVPAGIVVLNVPTQSVTSSFRGWMPLLLAPRVKEDHSLTASRSARSIMELSPLARKARGTLRTAVGVHWVHGIADASVSKGPVIQRAALRNVICGKNQSCNIELKRESSTHTPFVPCFSALP